MALKSVDDIEGCGFKKARLDFMDRWSIIILTLGVNGLLLKFIIF